MPVPPKPPGTRRRRNVQGVKPDHQLPISGRKGRIPKPPLPLGASGEAFWRAAWRTPQACTWHDGVTYSLARLAQLIDEYDQAQFVDERNKLGVRMEKGFIEFGLTPRAMSSLHLFVVDDEKADAVYQPAEPTAAAVDDDEFEMRRRLKEARTG